VTDSHGVLVRISAGINTVTREATWDLQALDPETGIQNYFLACFYGFLIDSCIFV